MSAQKSPVDTTSSDKKAFTTPSFLEYKQVGKRIVVCTAYDYMQAQIVQAAGVDVILVGDSLGMTTLGHDSTLKVTMDDMLRATAAVAKGAPNSYIIADMPFMSYQHSKSEGMRNAAAFVAQAGAHAIKVEGASLETLVFIEAVVDAGIPVVGHLGLTPQSINQLGGYYTQAKETDEVVKLMTDVYDLISAGVSAIVLECVPAEVAAELREMYAIPTIGIGSGINCDGEVQVFHDLLGLSDFTPRHTKHYLKGAELLSNALAEYVQEVRTGTFPTDLQSVSIDQKIVKDARAESERDLFE